MIKAMVGQTVSVTLPWSEVCMHMGLQDKTMNVLVLADGAQILREDGSNYCPPITHGEAGIEVVSVDPRFSVIAYEVHYWPHLGRILAINLPGIGGEPIVTDLRVAGMEDAWTKDDATLLTAGALAAFGNPRGEMFRHTADGRITKITWDNMGEIEIRSGG